MFAYFLTKSDLDLHLSLDLDHESHLCSECLQFAHMAMLWLEMNYPLEFELLLVLCDEDITPSNAHVDPSTVMQGSMTQARMRQLNLEVSSFLSDPFHRFKNRLLLNAIIFFRNMGECHEVHGERCGGREDQQGRPSQARGPIQLIRVCLGLQD